MPGYGHCAGRHHIQQLAPEEYGAFRDHAVRQMLAGELAGERAESLVERYIESRGGALTVDEAMDEISADYARELLTNRAAADKLICENRTLAQRFFDALKAMLKDISAFIEGLTGEARVLAESQKDDLQKGYELWREAFKAAESTAQNAQKNSVSPQDGIRYSRSVDKYYERQIDKWDGQDHGGGFRVGTPSQALLDIGIPDIDIWFDQSKAAKALREHGEVTKDVLKAIPRILGNPIVLAESYDNTVMAFGELYADGDTKKPITIALRIQSTKRNVKITLVNKIRSVGTRTHNLDGLLAEDHILYLSKNKIRPKHGSMP